MSDTAPQGGDPPEEMLDVAIDACEFAARPGQSACVLLDSGPIALQARAVLADEARRSIDLQTYIYDDDAAGIQLMKRLQAAAERGVRVRLLIDDNGLSSDECMPLLLDALPNAEVRVFNPYRFRPRWTRPFQLPFEFGRLNRRMHNKLYVVDEAAAVIGGRNLGDHYFDKDEAVNFTDLDVLLLGPVARDAQASFEQYWNSDLAVPLAEAMGRRDAEDARERIERYARTERFTELQQSYQPTQLRKLLAGSDNVVHWATTRIVADDPRKACERRRRRAHQVVYDALKTTWDDAKIEVLAATAYFVPGRRGASDLIRLRRRGVLVRILTNSLASNDVATVHAGYARYRRPLLRAGVELFEYQLFGNRPRHRRSASSHSSLHSKTIVIDRRRAWVGSFNIDLRSIRLNTEVAVLLESETLALDLAARIERDLRPDRSWCVKMTKVTHVLRWLGEKNGNQLARSHEPDTPWWLRAWVQIVRKVPGIERFL